MSELQLLPYVRRFFCFIIEFHFIVFNFLDNFGIVEIKYNYLYSLVRF